MQGHLRELALPNARLSVEVDGDDPGDAVTFRFAANPGEELAPLARVASGGELARTMLALRLVITEAPPTLVFDEVDAGIGGEAALAVGRALARLGAPHQVLVVTHLAQVAAYADAQVAVDKREEQGRTVGHGRGRRWRCSRDRALTDALGHAVERDAPASTPRSCSPPPPATATADPMTVWSPAGRIRPLVTNRLGGGVRRRCRTRGRGGARRGGRRGRARRPCARARVRPRRAR